MSLESSGSISGGVGIGVGVGNYKGVMLCNRPFGNSTAGATTKGSTSDSSSFICGLVPEAIGTNVPIPMKEKLLKRPKKDSVLCKHKKWLLDLQKTKERLEIQYLEEIRKKEEAQSKFQENEKTMRERQLTVLHSSYKGGESKEGFSDSKAAADFKEQFNSLGAEEKKQVRPVWAMTEKDADMAADRKEQLEEEELLKFAESLDFDKFVCDVEIQSMMDRLRRRIGELEKEVTAEDQKEADAEKWQAKKDLLSFMAKAENSLSRGVTANDLSEEEKNALAAARQLLQEDEDLQGVHSAKSVTALLKAAKEKIATVAASVRSASTPAGPQVSNEPLIIVHEPSEGTRFEGKNAIRNLPYMHRNPAV
eukprot:gene29388-38949_t